MKKVLLVNPHGTDQSGFSNPPLGLLYLAGSLRASGFSTRLVDACLDGEGCVYSAVEEFRPDVVGITSMTPGRHQALKIATGVKTRRPDSVVVLGGVHPTIMYRQILENYSSVDLIVRGEGEHAFIEILRETSLKSVPGIAFRSGDGIVDNGVRHPVEMLDSLPFPAWDMLDLNRYPAIDRGIYNGIDLTKTPRVSVIYSRGCSGSCHFCSSWWIWKGWRCRSATNMVEEIEWLYHEKDIRHFCFADDALTVDRNKAIALCDAIIRRNLRIVFHATTRSDCVDAEILEKLKAAGCYKIAIGVESASQTLLDRMGKKNEVRHAEHAIRLCKEAGLITTALMIVGNVGETEKTIAESLDFLKRSQPDEVGTVGGLWILPGTRLHKDCEQIGYIDEQFWLGKAPYKTYTLEHSAEELARFKKILMSYKTVSKGPTMAHPVSRYVAGESLLTKWNRYVDSTVNEYSATSQWRGVDELHRELFQKIPIHCNDILDLGCGDGWSTNELKKMGKNAVGITINPNEAKHALEKFGLTLAIQDMHDIRFPDQKFDCVYCREAFEHSVAPFIALCEINRVLKIDGFALINLPDTEWIREDSHFSVLTPAQMNEMFYKCRFTVEKFGRTDLGHYWYLARKVAEINQPNPYPPPDPKVPIIRQCPAEVADDRRPLPRVIGMMRIKNEAAWISDVLEGVKDLVQGFVILDDGSTDETPAICKSHPKVLRYEWQDEPETDEVRDKNRLLQWTLEYDPDWVIAIDGDEVLEGTALFTIRDAIAKASPDITKFGISFLYIWDCPDTYRIDGHYHEVRHPRIFKVKGLPIDPTALTFSPSRYGANFHCGSVPNNLPGETLYLDVRIKHYGYYSAEQRRAKQLFYEERDPQNAAKGYYRHLTQTDEIQLLPYYERSREEVLTPDSSAATAITTLKDAGNPLWQSALFYAPGCRSHLDIGTNRGATLSGLDPKTITAIEAYCPSARLLEKRYRRVLQGDACRIISQLASKGERFDRITLFDFIEHLSKEDGEALLTQLESMYTGEIILFVPLETDSLVNSAAYKEFMRRQFDRIPDDQHELQSHRSHWTPQEFERRGYAVTMIENFHMPGFHAFFAYRYFTRTIAELMQQRISDYLEKGRSLKFAEVSPPDKPQKLPAGPAEVFGHVGKGARILPLRLLTNPDKISIGDHVLIREGARLEAITHYRGVSYTPEIVIDAGTQIELDAHIGAARSIHIGKKVMIAGRVTILDHDHDYRNPLQPPIDQPLDVSPVVIEDGAWLGENCVICKGVTVGHHAVVGANAVVTRDIPPWSVVAGIPARLVKFYSQISGRWENSEGGTNQKASIIIPVFNHVDYTRACIHAVTSHTPAGSYDIIVIDNASSDGTAEYLSGLSNEAIRVIRNDTNCGFVDACNQGAAEANTPYLVFLNNDTEPRNGWLEALIKALERAPDIGAAGSKLIYPDGRLQEAGAVVFSDGTAKNFGRGDRPDAPAYNRTCEVDYCSGAALLVRRDLFHSLGGFDRQYAPAYYEETDLCFKIRDNGYRVIYVPGSEVVHHGSVTAGLDESSGFRKYLAVNRQKFVQRWQHTLNSHEPPLKPGERVYSADRRLLGLRKSVLLSGLANDTVPHNETEIESWLYTHFQALLEDGREQDALTALHDLIQFAPDFALARNDMGVLQCRQGDYTKAEAYYRSAVVLDTGNNTYRKNLADLLWVALHQSKEALAQYLVVLENCPEDIEALLAVGHISLQNGQPKDAHYFFNRILEIDPTNTGATEGLQKIITDAGFDTVHQNTESGIRYRQIMNLRDAGRVEEAINALQTWVHDEPEDAIAWNDLGLLYLEAGITSKAGNCLEKAAELQPHNASFLKGLAEYYFATAKAVGKAWVIYSRLADLCPDDETVLWGAAQMAARANHRKRSVELCDRVLELNPGHSEASELRRFGFSISLDGYPAPSGANESGKRLRIVVVSSCAPQIESSSANLRIYHIVQMMAASGSEVLFLHPSASSQPEGRVAGFSDNVTIRFLGADVQSYLDIIARFQPGFIWMTNLWHLPYVEFLAQLIRALPDGSHSRVIVDTMDFHHKKFIRKHRLSGRDEDLATAQQFFSLEDRLYHKADKIVVVTDAEAEDIRKTWPDVAPIDIVPNIHVPIDNWADIKNRHHICFLGNFTVNHNRDAAHHFAANIFPLIKAKIPQAEFHLMGIGSETLAEDFGSKSIRGIGFVQDLNETLSTYKVFVCPMLYGAGMKGKIGVAASAGIPMVTTSIGIEGIPMVHNQDCLIADEAEAFADACLRLMRDAEIWYQLQKNAAGVIAEHFSPSAVESHLNRILEMPEFASSRQVTTNPGDSTDTLLDNLERILMQKDWSHKQSLYASHIESVERLRSYSKPAVSIIVVTWRLHPDTVQCLEHLEKERHLNYELIIVDNGAAHGALASLRPYADSWVRLGKNTGACIARNIGAIYAQAPLLLFIDDDALPGPNLIAAHLNVHATYDVIAVRGACQPRNPGNAFNILGQHYYLGDRPLPHYADIEGNTSYRAETFFAVGGWDDELFFGHEGIALALRLWRYDNDRRKQIYSPDPVIFHDYATDQTHLEAKHHKQMQSRQLIEDRYPDYMAFVESWENFSIDDVPILKKLPASMIDRPVVSYTEFPSVFEADPERTFVSIVIPTHNRAPLLKAAIESALAQSYSNFEIVVIDDASDDETTQVVRAFDSTRIRYIRKHHSGAPDTRNRGIREAQGEFILWLDDDDLLLPSALESQVRVAQANPSADVIYGRHVKFNHATGEILGVLNPKDWSFKPEMLFNGLLGACPIPNPGTLVRRSAYEEIGEYNLSFSRAHDYEFWSRAVAKLTFVKNHAVLCRYRVHETNMSTGQFIDQSFESLIVRFMVARYGFNRLFPWLNWEQREEARTAACFLTAERLFGLNDYHNAIKFLEQIPEMHLTIDMMSLHIRCIAYLKEWKDVEQLVKRYQGHPNAAPTQLLEMKHCFQVYFQDLQRAQDHLEHNSLEQAVGYFQDIVEQDHAPSSNSLLLKGYLDKSIGNSDERYKLARKAVQSNPSSIVVKNALAMIGDADYESELEQTRRRILADPAESLTVETDQAIQQGLAPAGADGLPRVTTHSDASVSVIIPVLGNGKHLLICLKSLTTCQPDAEIICSYEQTSQLKKLVSRAKKRFPKVNSIALEIGATEVELLNAGLAEASGSYLCLLRPHLTGDNGWLASMAETYRKVPSPGVVGPIADIFRNQQQPSPILRDHLSQPHHLARLRDGWRHRRTEVSILEGDCVFFSREFATVIGPLDDQFRTQGYAVRDFCCRSMAAGYRNFIVADVQLDSTSDKASGKGKHHLEHQAADRLAFCANWQSIGKNASRAAVIFNLLSQFEEKLQKGNLNDAMGLCRDQSDLITKHNMLWLRIGFLLQRFGQNEALSDLLTHAPSICKNPEAMVLKAYYHVGAKNHEIARTHAEMLRQHQSFSAPAHDLLGIIAFSEGHISESRQLFEKAIKIDSGYALAHNHLAAILWSDGLEDLALQSFELSFMIDPSRQDIFTDFHKASVALESYDRAVVLFREACRLYPRHRQLRYLLIDLLIKQGCFETAMREIETAMALFGCSGGMVEAALEVRKRVGNDSLPNKSPLKKKVSLCMITKNEERHLARCLHSAKPVVDEIIVVDTGSSDQTRQIAQAFGAHVFDFEWRHDFAAARNYGIDKAQGDLIFVLDADEVIAPQDHKELERVFGRKESLRYGYSITTRNYTNLCNIIGWNANGGEYPAEEIGTGWTPSEKVRIFPNDPAIRFCYPVHEVVGPALKQKKITIARCDVPIHHYGKMDQDANQSKGEAYFRIGLKKVEEIGGDEQALTELAVQAGLLGKSNDAVSLWKRILKINPNSVRALVNLSSALGRLNQLTEAARLAQQAVHLAPHMKEAHFNLSLSLLLLGDAHKAIEILETLQAQFPKYYAAIFMLGCAKICIGEHTNGLQSISTLKGTELWPALHHSFDELASNLLQADRIDYHTNLLQSKRNLYADEAVVPSLAPGAMTQLRNDALNTSAA